MAVGFTAAVGLPLDHTQGGPGYRWITHRSGVTVGTIQIKSKVERDGINYSKAQTLHGEVMEESARKSKYGEELIRVLIS